MTVAVATVAILATLAAAGLSVWATVRDRWRLGLAALAPAAAGLVVRAGGIHVDLPAARWVGVVLAAAVLLLGAAGGGPLAAGLIALTERRSGGGGSADAALRGGTTIGYLERVAVLAAVGVGRWEVLAAVVAVKALGRFRDLDSARVSEQFIIGTLASLLWAGLCAGLVWPSAL